MCSHNPLSGQDGGASFPGTHASLVEGVCVCATLGITGILSDCFVLVLLRILQQGVPGMHTGLAPTKTPVLHL